MTDIITSRLDDLEAAVEAAKNAKADPVIDSIKKAVDKITEVLYSDEAKTAFNQKIANTENETLAKDFLTVVTDVKNFLLINSTSDVNGEEAANRVKGLLMAEMIEDGPVKDRAITLLEGWVSSRPKRKSQSEGPVTTPAPDFTFSTIAKCALCDEDIYHEGSRSGQTRWAHLKSMVKTHHGEKHGSKDIGDLKLWSDARDSMAAGEMEVRVAGYSIRKG